jgi:hypothetical protein
MRHHHSGEPDFVQPAYGPELPFERIAINQGALCIECKACGRRSALTSENCRHIHRGNKTLVKTMRFKCRRHGCASTDVRLAPWRAGADHAPMGFTLGSYPAR